MNPLAAFIPEDRRIALARGASLPDPTRGAALLADISGFTPLTDALTQTLGAQRGGEDLIRQINAVYESLIASVVAHGGSVIGFAGDALLCWFDEKDDADLFSSLRAMACARAMQTAMHALANIALVNGARLPLAIKIAIASGAARRLIVGDPQIQLIDVLAGETPARTTRAEHLARPGEVIVDRPTLDADSAVQVREWRADANGEAFAVIEPSDRTGASFDARAPIELALSDAQLRSWVLPAVYESYRVGLAEFAPELRPAVALFARVHALPLDETGALIQRAQEIIARYDGALIQLTFDDHGNYFYATFGALSAHEDDARRAVYAAFDLQKLARLSIGIGRGMMRVGAYGARTRRTFGALGDKTNLAARLMQTAPPGEIFISGRIAAALGADIAAQALPPIRVKGKAGLVRVYRPINQPAPVVRPHSEIIGRRAEIASIEKILDAVQRGATRVLIVEGEAGIGKSRLVDKLKHLTRMHGLTWLIGYGQSIEQHTPYRAWRDVFNAYFDLDNRESRLLEETWILNERRARVEALVAQLAPEHTPRLPVLNDVLGLGIPENDLTQSFDANLRQQNVSLILTALLHAWAVERPFVLILEDAHWLDGLAGQLALDVARALATARAPFLFVLVNRPLDANRAGQKIFDALRALDITQSLTLSALAPNEIIALIADRLNVPASVLPAPLIALVQSRANGNPFFAEELVFNLRDNGIIVQRGARILLAQDLTQSTQTLSDTLHGLILSRIDRLPPQRQFVIKVAAVIGRAFAFAPLHHIVNQYVTMVDDSLKDHLVALTHADFTFLETLEPELTYLFKHIITQEVAYQTLLFSQRRELHRLVAEWYEGNQQSTADSESSHTVYYPLLAYHYRYAEDLAKEKQYLGLAADAAEKIFANDAAIGFYTRWLDILANEAKPSPLQVSEMALSREPATWLRSAQDALRAMTRLKRGKRFESVGRWNDAEQDYRAALSIASHNQDARLQTHGYFTLGDLERQRARYASARDHLTRALTLAESTGARDWQAHSLIALGKILGEQGDYVRAQEHFVQALELERALGDARGEANALHALGNIAIFRAEYACAAEYYSQASVIFRALGARADEGNTLNNLGTIALYRGEYDRAANFYADALARAREVGARRNESNALGNLGIVAHYQADYARALDYTEQALAIDRAMGHQQGIGRKLNALGESARAQGDYARAQTYYAEALAIARAIGEQRSISIALGNLGLIALDQQDYLTALAQYTEATAIARALGDRNRIGYTLTGLAEARAGLGQFADAEATMREAIEVRRQVGQMALVLESVAGLAHIYLAQDERARALDVAQEILAAVDRDQSLDAANEPLRILLTCYHVLALNDHSRAPDILAITFCRLRERLARITDPDTRRAVIAQSPWCREIVAAWAQSAQVSREQAIDEAMRP